MSIVTDIRKGIATNLRTAITTAQVCDYLISAPTGPTLWVYPDDVDYTESEGTDYRRFIVEALAGTSIEEAAQVVLDDFMGNGATSVKKAIETDKTLGGLAVVVFVRSCSGYRFVSRAGAELLAVQWTVDVHASNTDDESES